MLQACVFHCLLYFVVMIEKPTFPEIEEPQDEKENWHWSIRMKLLKTTPDEPSLLGPHPPASHWFPSPLAQSPGWSKRPFLAWFQHVGQDSLVRPCASGEGSIISLLYKPSVNPKRSFCLSWAVISGFTWRQNAKDFKTSRTSVSQIVCKCNRFIISHYVGVCEPQELTLSFDVNLREKPLVWA